MMNDNLVQVLCANMMKVAGVADKQVIKTLRAAGLVPGNETMGQRLWRGIGRGALSTAGSAAFPFTAISNNKNPLAADFIGKTQNPQAALDAIKQIERAGYRIGSGGPRSAFRMGGLAAMSALPIGILLAIAQNKNKSTEI